MSADIQFDESMAMEEKLSVFLSIGFNSREREKR